MTSRFKMGLVLLGALALACAALLLLQDDTAPAPRPVDLTADERGGGTSGERPGLAGSTDDGSGGPGLEPGMQPGDSGSLVGSREPRGPDLSSATAREAELRRLLRVQPISWLKVAEVVGIMQPGEAIADDLRPVILGELRSGKRLQVMHVFSQLRDPAFVGSLFDVLDDPAANPGHQRAALEALWRMPAGSDDDIARRLEGRLSNDLRKDTVILRAIGKRGGPEAARAIVEYLQRAQNPLDAKLHVLQSLDVSTDAKAAEIVAEALGREQPPKVQKALIQIVMRPGALGVTEPLIALDRPGVPDDVRTQAILALGRVGDERSAAYLLEKASDPGVFGQRALHAVSRLETGDEKVGALLAKALESVDANPRPELAKSTYLRAIGRIGHAESLPAVARALDDRSPKVQEAALQALGGMGAGARAYVPKLVRLYDGGDLRQRRDVAVALGSIGGHAAVRELRRLLEQKDLAPAVKRTLQFALRTAEEDLRKEQR